MSLRTQNHSAAVIVWGSVCLTMLRLSLEASNWLILWYVYGWSRVAHEHLLIVRAKPELAVSNGDVLHGLGFLHFLAGVSLWLAGTFAVFNLVVKPLAPAWREAKRPMERVGAIGIIAVLVMFLAIPVLLPLGRAVTLGALAAAAGICWLRRTPRNKHD